MESPRWRPRYKNARRPGSQQAAERHNERLHPLFGDEQSVTRPIMAPMERMMRAATGHGTPRLAIRSTKITLRSAIMEPTDSSMPPVIMTKASAIANMPNSPTRLAVLEMFTGDRNRGFISATTVPTTIIRIKSPRSFLRFSIRPPRLSQTARSMAGTERRFCPEFNWCAPPGPFQPRAAGCSLRCTAHA